jgi:hypothetical protein
MTNKELVSKIDKGLASVKDLSAGGYLNSMQAEKFIRGIIDQPTIIKSCRTVIIKGEHKKIEKIGFGNRIMRRGIEHTPLHKNDYARPQYGKVDLYTRETIAETRLSYDTLEANIEQKGIRNTIISLLQERIALDLEELVVRGDMDYYGDEESDHFDDYLSILDGVLKKTNKWVVDVAGEDCPTLGQWTRLIKAVPQKYLRVPEQWRIYVNRLTDLAWRNKIAARNTAAGDRFLLDNQDSVALGFKIKPITMMPGGLLAGQYPPWPTQPPVPHSPYTGDTHAGGGDGDAVDAEQSSQALMIHPKNIIVGFTRSVQMEYDKDISARQIIIVTTLKVDCAIEEVDATAKMINMNPVFPEELIGS